MKTRFLFLALVGSQLLAACATQADLADPDKLMAAEPTAAGPQPLTRQQVIADMERARRAGDMDYANSEASLEVPRKR
jgi:predicted outer membrane protein